MKKITIFVILLLVFMPVAFADTLTDWVRGLFDGNSVTGKVTVQDNHVWQKNDGTYVGKGCKLYLTGTDACVSKYGNNFDSDTPPTPYKNANTGCGVEKTANLYICVEIVEEQVDNSQGQCTDSDGWDKYYEKGYVIEKGITHWDTCWSGLLYNGEAVESGQGVAEYACYTGEKGGAVDYSKYVNSGGWMTFGVYQCPNGCKDGACVTQGQCTDSDGGLNYYVKGLTSYKDNIAADGCGSFAGICPVASGCGNGDYLTEWVCDPNGYEEGAFSSEGYAPRFYNCQSEGKICKDGACVKDTGTTTVEVGTTVNDGDLIDLGSPIASKGQDAFSDGLGTLTIDAKSPTIETSLTSAEDDYQTDVVMEVQQRDSIRYTLINPGNLIRSSTNPIYISLLGKEMKVTRVETDTSLVVDGKLARDGDAFYGEDLDDPNWVWNLDNLMSDNPTVGIENDFIWNDDSDNPAGIGECLYLPSNYAQICFDNLNVGKDEYDTYRIEFDKNTDLSDAGAGTNVPTVYIFTKGKKVVSEIDSKDIWITGNGSVYYKDSTTNRVKYWKKILNEKIGTIGPNLDLTSDIVNNNLYINVNSMNQKTTLAAKFKMDINMTIPIVISLGKINSMEEADELTYGNQGGNILNIGAKDEDHRTSYGVIIRNPKAHGASDEVVLEIPRKQVKAKVSVEIKKESPTPSSSITLVNIGENAIIVDIGGVKKTISLGSVVSIDQETAIGVLGVNKEKRSAVLLIGKPNTYYTMESIEEEPATVEEGTEACSTWDNMLGRC